MQRYGPDQPARSIAGAVVLITGAASGIGAAIAKLFAAEGAFVAVTDVDGTAATVVAEEILTGGGQARAWALDVGDLSCVADVSAEVAAQWGGLDCLINNAGVSLHSPIGDDDYETHWSRAMQVMLTAIPRMVRATLPYLRNSPHPRILNIASTEAFAATRELSPYAAAKAGVTGITRSLAVELGRAGITVNCIAPGPIETGMTRDIPEVDRQIYARRRTALGRYGRPDEIAHIALSLCLPGATYVTGATIPVDGGLLIRNA